MITKDVIMRKGSIKLHYIPAPFIKADIHFRYEIFYRKWSNYITWALLAKGQYAAGKIN